jgi:ribosome maturation factor RimP
MITEQKILDFFNKHIINNNANLFIVDIKISNNNKIVIFIDDFQGITIDKCAEINRKIEKEFETEIGNYELEVSSPGLNMPFKVENQYLKNINNQISILLKDGMKYNGILKYSDNDIVKIEQTNISKIKGKKQKETNEFIINKENIKETKLIISI